MGQDKKGIISRLVVLVGLFFIIISQSGFGSCGSTSSIGGGSNLDGSVIDSGSTGGDGEEGLISTPVGAAPPSLTSPDTGSLITYSSNMSGEYPAGGSV